MKNKNNRLNKITKYIFFLGLFLIVLGTSYALFSLTLTSTKRMRFKTKNIHVILTDVDGNEEEEGIAVDLDKAIPEADKDGLKRDGYKFVVTNTGEIPASYHLKLNGTGTLSGQYIKYALIKKDYLKKSDNTYYNGGIYSNAYRKTYIDSYDWDDPLTLSTLDDNKLDSTTLLPGEKMEYELKLWVKEDATVEQVSGKLYEANVVVDAYNALVYTSGKAGDNANYTLYKDGTLAVTGSGELKGFNYYKNSNDNAVYEYYNNGGIVTDIFIKYLNKKNYNIESFDGYSLEMNDSVTDEDRSKVNLYTMYTVIGAEANDLNTLNAEYNDIDSFFRSFIGWYLEYMGKSASRNDVNTFINMLKKFPVHITRFVIDEGITSVSKAHMTTGNYSSYMKTLPSTLNDLGGVDSEFMYEVAYGLIIPPNIKTIKEDRSLGIFLKHLDLANVETIEKNGIITYGIEELTIPNSVSRIDEKGITVREHDITINIDNTQEYVEQNWDSNWLSSYNSNITTNYLR